MNSPTREAIQAAVLAAPDSTPPTPALPSGIRRVNLQSLAVLYKAGSPLYAHLLAGAPGDDLQFSPDDLILFAWAHCAPAREVAAAMAYTDSPASAIRAAAYEWSSSIEPSAIAQIISAISRDQRDISAGATEAKPDPKADSEESVKN